MCVVQSVRHRLRVSAAALCFAAGALSSFGYPSDASAAPSIRFNGEGRDVFVFHGRVKLAPPTHGGPVDPVRDGFGLELSNELGVIYAAALGPGDLEDMGKLRYRFKDKLAKYGAGSHGGLYHVLNRFRKFDGIWYYTVRIRAHSDLSLATEAVMTLLLFEVNGPASLTAEWVERKNGWRLPLNRFARSHRVAGP